MKNYSFYGCDTVKLAEEYGTPLYVISEDFIKDRCYEIKKDFLDKHPNTKAAYASKAFLTKEMARIIKDVGLEIDVVSGGELYTVIQVGFPMERVIFHGNNKTLDEIDLGVKHDVGRFVVDNLLELDLIQQAASKHNKKINILFRISPGVESNTHRYMQTGQMDSKFGIPLTHENIREAMDKVRTLKNIELLGFHFHIGSQISSNINHLESTEVIIKLMKYVRDQFGFITRELNTGGGYGIHYSGEEKRMHLRYFTDAIMDKVQSGCRKYKLKRPTVVIEPGRWIVGEAGITLYTIGAIKKIPGIRTYVSVDGGMPDNPRPSLYEAKYEGIVINKMDEDLTELVTVAGKCCESGDVLIWDLKAPKIESGDLLAVLSTGAYNHSMSSNYNKIPRPAMVMVTNGKHRLIVKRETYEDLLRNEI